MNSVSPFLPRMLAALEGRVSVSCSLLAKGRGNRSQTWMDTSQKENPGGLGLPIGLPIGWLPATPSIKKRRNYQR